MKYSISIIVLLLVLFGCKDSPVTTTTTPPPPPPPPPPVQSVYVLNEGNYGDPFGARLTMYDIVNDTVYYDVFEAANSPYHLGSLGDDMKLHRGFLYLLMSSSQNLVVIRADNHRLLYHYYFNVVPHDFVIDTIRSKAYITQLYNNEVYVFSLGTSSITDSIAVGANPQGMLIDSATNQLFICNSGYGTDSTVTIVDITTDTVKATLTVGIGPNAIARLQNGNIMISCQGNPFSSPPSNGKLMMINPATNTVIDSINFSDNLFGGICVDSTGLVYVLGGIPNDFYGGPVHRVNPATKDVTTNFIPGAYYSLTLDAATDDLYLTNVKNFSADGDVLIYRKDGTLKKLFQAEKGPATIVFRR